ncbi:MAG: hypothetical protein K9J76_02705 [Polaromonas sp.]|nr:hypothetical protein [Polaromonas sp.]
MRSISSIRILELLSSREKLFLLFSYIALVVLISAPLIYFDVSEGLYQFSRAYEHRQLDELILIALAALFILSIYLILMAIHLGKRLILTKSEKQNLQRSIDQTRHLVAMGTVLGGVSHSVNNHLLPVITLTTMLLEDLDPNSEVAKDLGVVLNAAIGAAHIIKQLKNFSRQEMAVRETCNLGLALAHALQLCEQIVPSSIFLDKNIETLNVQVALSEVSLEIVILNLIMNAVDAIGGAQGRIGISLASSEVPAEASDALKVYSAWINLRIEDSGEGMSDSQIGKIFEPFYTTKPAGKGTGLGLSETYGIIKAGGGYVHVESTPRVGAAFSIRLPVLLNEDRQGSSRFTPL